MLSYVTICVIFYKLYVKQNEKLYWIINQKKKRNEVLQQSIFNFNSVESST